MLRYWLSDLKTHQPELANDVLERRRLLWLGSGLSLRQAPDLVELMMKAVLFLRDKAQAGPNPAEHEDALRRLLNKFLPDEVARYDADPVAWSPLDLRPLRTSYSDVLGIRVTGKPGNYLLLEAADVPHTYGDPAREPGPDHELLAILIIEGVVGYMASGNWDGLIEKAVATLSDDPGMLSVHVVADDLRDQTDRNWLTKFHGCAVRAVMEPAKYENSLVATRTQIVGWATAPEFAHMRDSLTEKTQRLRSLVLGLSIQDQDLLETFAFAAQGHPWAWDEGHPAYVFAEPILLSSQEDVLDLCYGSDFDTHRDEIIRTSATGNFGGPLLAALTAYVVSEKMKAALGRLSGVAPGLAVDLGPGLDRLLELVSRTIGGRYEALPAFLVDGLSPLIKQYFGERHFVGSSKYVALVPGTRSAIATDPTVTMNGTDWFALTLALFGRGSEKASWRVRTTFDDGFVFLRTSSPVMEPRRAAVVRGAEAADAVLRSNAWNSGEGPMTLIHAGERPLQAARSSRSRLGSARSASNRNEVWLPDAITHARDADEAFANFVTAGSF